MFKVLSQRHIANRYVTPRCQDRPLNWWWDRSIGLLMLRLPPTQSRSWWCRVVDVILFCLSVGGITREVR